MGLIYKRTSPSGGIYIGQTTLTKEIQRWKQHCYDAKTSNDTSILHEAIRKYGKDSFTVEILEDNIEEKMLDEREIFWIRFYDTYHYDNPKNYNLTRGGNQGIGYHHTEEWKRAHSIKMSGDNNPSKRYKRCWINDGDTNYTICVQDLNQYLTKGYIKGRIESEKAIEAQSLKKGVPKDVGIWMSDGETSKRVICEDDKQNLLGKGFIENKRSYKHSEITKKKLSDKLSREGNPRFGTTVSQEQLDKALKTKLERGSVKRVAMYDKDTNNLIRIFSSAAHAGKYVKENNLCSATKEPNGIRSCCKNIQKSAYGYVWRYIE